MNNQETNVWRDFMAKNPILSVLLAVALGGSAGIGGVKITTAGAQSAKATRDSLELEIITAKKDIIVLQRDLARVERNNADEKKEIRAELKSIRDYLKELVLKMK